MQEVCSTGNHYTSGGKSWCVPGLHCKIGFEQGTTTAAPKVHCIPQRITLPTTCERSTVSPLAVPPAIVTRPAIQALKQLGKRVNVRARFACATKHGLGFAGDGFQRWFSGRFRSPSRFNPDRASNRMPPLSREPVIYEAKSSRLEHCLSARHGLNVFLDLLRRLVILKATKQEIALHVQDLVIAGERSRHSTEFMLPSIRGTHDAVKDENNSATMFDAEIFRFICS